MLLSTCTLSIPSCLINKTQKTEGFGLDNWAYSSVTSKVEKAQGKLSTQIRDMLRQRCPLDIQSRQVEQAGIQERGQDQREQFGSGLFSVDILET